MERGTLVIADDYREYSEEILSLGSTLSACARAVGANPGTLRRRLITGPPAALIALAGLDDETILRQIAAIRIGIERRRKNARPIPRI